MAIGIPDSLFWDLTLREIEAVVLRHREFQRFSAKRSALITAAVYNVHRKPGTAFFHAEDFLRQERTEEDYASVEESARMLNVWARQINAAVDKAKDQPVEIVKEIP